MERSFVLGGHFGPRSSDSRKKLEILRAHFKFQGLGLMAGSEMHISGQVIGPEKPHMPASLNSLPRLATRI